MLCLCGNVANEEVLLKGSRFGEALEEFDDFEPAQFVFKNDIITKIKQ